jgi:hypothetical protein
MKIHTKWSKGLINKQSFFFKNSKKKTLWHDTWQGERLSYTSVELDCTFLTVLVLRMFVGLYSRNRVPMVAAVHRSSAVYNSTVLDTEDSEFSETADQIRSYHSVVVVPEDSRQGNPGRKNRGVS